jgi:RNA polymerase sigma-70 factor (ECF subfamily)
MVLILRDVLAWPAADTAALLGVSEPEVDVELARARDSVRGEQPGPAERAALQRLLGSTDPVEVGLLRALLREHPRAA